MNFVNSMTNWNQEEKRKYINTFVEPYCFHMIDSTDIEKEIKIKTVLKNNILKDVNIPHAIMDKYINIIINNASENDYVNFYKKLFFCLVPLYIELNKKSSERLLVVYKKLIKTIWPSITLLKHYIRRFQIKQLIMMIMMILQTMIKQ